MSSRPFLRAASVWNSEVGCEQEPQVDTSGAVEDSGLEDQNPEDEPASWGSILTNASLLGLGNMLTYMVIVVNSAVSGHSGSDNDDQVAMLAGYGLAQACQNMMHIGPAMGITCVFDTLVSQANGAEDFARCLRLLGQGRAVLTVHWLVIAPVAWFSEEIFSSFGLDAQSAHYAGVFNRINMISWWFRSMTYASRRFLANMNRPGPNTLVATVVLSLHICILGLMGFRVRLETLAYTTIFTSAVQAISLWAYLLHAAKSLRLDRLSVIRQTFHISDLDEFARLAIPNVAQTCGELWAFEIFTIMAGWIDSPSLAACTVAYHITTLSYLLGTGVSSAATGLIGEAWGQCRPAKARRTAVRFVVIVLGLWLPKVIVLFLEAQSISAFFSPQHAVQAVLAPVLRLYSCVLVIDDLNLLLGSMLRAIGRTDSIAMAYIIFYYPILLPLAYYFAFPMDLGVWGMYLTYGIASVGITVTLATVSFAGFNSKMPARGMRQELL